MKASCAWLAFGRNALYHRSGQASTSRRNDFSPHCDARAQGPHVSGMIAVHIITVHIWKGLRAFWIHAFVCYNSLRWWRIFRTETECHWHIQKWNTEYSQRKTRSMLMVAVLQRSWHLTWGKQISTSRNNKSETNAYWAEMRNNVKMLLKVVVVDFVSSSGLKFEHSN